MSSCPAEASFWDKWPHLDFFRGRNSFGRELRDGQFQLSGFWNYNKLQVKGVPHDWGQDMTSIFLKLCKIVEVKPGGSWKKEDVSWEVLNHGVRGTKRSLSENSSRPSGSFLGMNTRVPMWAGNKSIQHTGIESEAIKIGWKLECP